MEVPREGRISEWQKAPQWERFLQVDPPLPCTLSGESLRVVHNTKVLSQNHNTDNNIKGEWRDIFVQ